MVYNYTRPRGRIAAMDSSPGPCYALPGLVGYNHHDPRSVHNRGPAYPFGVRHAQETSDSSPGPRYLPDRKTYRTGRDGSPHYSMQSRTKTPSWSTTPGPAAYHPEDGMPRSRNSTPAFSFGSREKSTTRSGSPGPNHYVVPGLLGKTFVSGKRQAPSYSLSGRTVQGSFHEDLRQTPGPGAYMITDIGRYKSAPPRYSISGRHYMPGDADSGFTTDVKPGPGAHSAEKVKHIG